MLRFTRRRASSHNELKFSKPFFLHTYSDTAPASWNMTKQCGLYDGEAADPSVAQRGQSWLGCWGGGWLPDSLGANGTTSEVNSRFQSMSRCSAPNPNPRESISELNRTKSNYRCIDLGRLSTTGVAVQIVLCTTMTTEVILMFIFLWCGALNPHERNIRAMPKKPPVRLCFIEMV